MGKKRSKQHNKSKNRNGANKTNPNKQSNRGIGLSEDVRVVHGEENNPHDG